MNSLVWGRPREKFLNTAAKGKFSRDASEVAHLYSWCQVEACSLELPERHSERPKGHGFGDNYAA